MRTVIKHLFVMLIVISCMNYSYSMGAQQSNPQSLVDLSIECIAVKLSPDLPTFGQYLKSTTLVADVKNKILSRYAKLNPDKVLCLVLFCVECCFEEMASSPQTLPEIGKKRKEAALGSNSKQEYKQNVDTFVATLQKERANGNAELLYLNRCNSFFAQAALGLLQRELCNDKYKNKANPQLLTIVYTYFENADFDKKQQAYAIIDTLVVLLNQDDIVQSIRQLLVKNEHNAFDLLTRMLHFKKDLWKVGHMIVELVKDAYSFGCQSALNSLVSLAHTRSDIDLRKLQKALTFPVLTLESGTPLPQDVVKKILLGQPCDVPQDDCLWDDICLIATQRGYLHYVTQCNPTVSDLERAVKYGHLSCVLQLVEGNDLDDDTLQSIARAVFFKYDDCIIHYVNYIVTKRQFSEIELYKILKPVIQYKSAHLGKKIVQLISNSPLFPYIQDCLRAAVCSAIKKKCSYEHIAFIIESVDSETVFNSHPGLRAVRNPKFTNYALYDAMMCEEPDLTLIQKLIEHGIRDVPFILNNQQVSALTVARNKNNDGAIKLLTTNGMALT